MTNANGAKVSLGEYAVSLVGAKIKTIALQAATMAMNAALSMGISFLITKGISALTSWIDSLVITKEEIKEAAEEAKSAIDEIKSNFDALSSSTNNIKKRFAELAQSVDNLGKTNQSRGKLSTEDYNEFLDLSNQLAELFPQLRIGFDDNGNAILDLSGNVDTIVSSLNNLVSVQQKLANQQILEKMPDVWTGYSSDLEGYQNSLKFLEKRTIAVDEAMQNLSKNKPFEFTTPKHQVAIASNMLETALTNMGYDPDEYKETKLHDYKNGAASKRTVTWDFSSFNDAELEQLKNSLASLGAEYEDSMLLAKNKIASANSEMSSYINTWLTTGSGKWNFVQMSSDMQNVVKDVLTKTQGTLGKITEENTDSYIANLKDMGIANAEEVVTEYKASKDEFGTLLSEAYEEWQTHLNDEGQALEAYLLATDTKNAELMNAFGEEYSTDYQNWLELLQKKKDAYDAYRGAVEGTLVQTSNELTDQVLNKGLMPILYAEYENQDKKIKELADGYSAKLASKFTSNSLDFTGSKDSSSSSDKDTSQTYDWIETKIKRLNEALDTIKAKADNTYSLWTKRNTELANAISKTKDAIDLQSQAYTRYMQEADSVGLSDSYKRLVQSGAIDISTVSDETLKDKISDYQTW